MHLCRQILYDKTNSVLSAYFREEIVQVWGFSPLCGVHTVSPSSHGFSPSANGGKQCHFGRGNGVALAVRLHSKIGQQSAGIKGKEKMCQGQENIWDKS